jgi:type I restriction enzyme R subunit
MGFTEDTVEQAALSWLRETGYTVVTGDAIAPGAEAAERETWAEAVLVDRLRNAIRRLNPELPDEACEDTLRKVLRPDLPSLIQNNRAFHRRLRDSVEVEYRRGDGSIAGDHVRLIATDTMSQNDFLAVNQFTIIEGARRRLDIVLFVNGLPLVIIELKSQADMGATIEDNRRRLRGSYRSRGDDHQGAAQDEVGSARSDGWGR